MNLDKLDIELVERTPVQSTNLGLVLARRYYKTLWLASLVAMLPFYLLTMILLWGLEWGWAFIVFWFFKPFYDRVLLENLSQLILNQPKTIWDIFRSLRAACRYGVVLSLTWHRFSTIRSFSLPIRLLEGQSGAAYRLRLQSLIKAMPASPTSITILFLALEQAILLSVAMLLMLIFPREWFDFGELIELVSGEAIYANSFFTTIYVLVVICLEPFFVATGFSVYLNQRILSEAWDIDVIFRNMVTRLGKGVIVLFIGVCLLTLPVDTWADSKSVAPQVNTSAQKQQLSEILAESDITPYKNIPAPKKNIENYSWLERLFEWLFGAESEASSDTNIDIGSIVKLLLLCALLVAGLYVIARYRHVLALFQKSSSHTIEKPDVIFGLDVRADTLPMNAETEALRLIEQDDYIGALSLLYRCSLSKLIHDGNLSIRSGDTEGDCLQASKSILSTQTYDCFLRLTKMWQEAVYAHQAPEKEALTKLATSWSRQHFYQDNVQVLT